MVETAANPNGKSSGFWLRAVFVTLIFLGILISTSFQDYFTACSFWYALPLTDHFDFETSIHYSLLSK
jgi:hypothetical protein